MVISGIGNPERGELKRKAIALGAEYRADWAPEATLLVCAHPDTPKYQQALGAGCNAIVSPQFIHDCYAMRRRLDETRYRIGNSDVSSPAKEPSTADRLARLQEAAPMPSFFANLWFYCDASVSGELFKQARRSIYAYDGFVPITVLLTHKKGACVNFECNQASSGAMPHFDTAIERRQR